MRYENSAAGRQLSILISELDLPTDEAERDRLLEELQTAIETVLGNYGRDPNRSKTIDGHAYSAIEDECPECRKDLKLIGAALDSSNGASARASCECGWSGEAIYRLIDLYESRSSDEAESGAIEPNSDRSFSDTSSVKKHGIEPRYYPY